VAEILKLIGGGVKHGLARIQRWPGDQVTAAGKGARNVVDFFDFSIAALAHDLGHVFHAFWSGIASIIAGFRDLIKQVAGDLVNGVRRVATGLVTLVTRVIRLLLRPFTAILGPVIRPIERVFASKAKEEALGYSVTSDQQSHKELIAFGLIVFVLLAVAGWYITTGSTSGLPVDLGPLLAHFTPERIIAKLASFSPSQLLLVVSAAALGLLGVVFWFQMLRDSWRRNYDSNTERTKWRLTTTLFFIPGALYYFWNVYNHWTLRQFFAYHLLSVMVTSVALIVATSTYGTLWYFNQRAQADVKSSDVFQVPSLKVDAATQQALLSRAKYGAPLTGNPAGGRTDPFAPVPGLATPAPSPAPGASPSPSPSPTPGS
jgi:hypothetical protein